MNPGKRFCFRSFRLIQEEQQPPPPPSSHDPQPLYAYCLVRASEDLLTAFSEVDQLLGARRRMEEHTGMSAGKRRRSDGGGGGGG